MLFFPKKWANSVVRWIAGVHLPSGTIKVGNTLDPTDDGSIALDVNVDAVAKETLDRIDSRPITNGERERFKFHLRGAVDGSSILMSDGQIAVSGEFIENICRQFQSENIPEVDLSDCLKTADIGETVAAQTHEHTIYDITDFDPSDYALADHNHDAAYAGINHNHSGVYAASVHSHALSDITGNIAGHSGTCYVTIGNDGSLGHSTNAEYNLLHDANTTSGVTKLLTNKDIGVSGGAAAYSHTHSLSDIDSIADGISNALADMFSASDIEDALEAAANDVVSDYATSSVLSPLLEAAVDEIVEDYVTASRMNNQLSSKIQAMVLDHGDSMTAQDWDDAIAAELHTTIGAWCTSTRMQTALATEMTSLVDETITASDLADALNGATTNEVDEYCTAARMQSALHTAMATEVGSYVTQAQVDAALAAAAQAMWSAWEEDYGYPSSSDIDAAVASAVSAAVADAVDGFDVSAAFESALYEATGDSVADLVSDALEDMDVLLDTDVGNGLELGSEQSGALKVKAKSGGGLAVDSDGVSVEVKSGGGLVYDSTSGAAGLKIGGFAVSNDSRVMCVNMQGALTLQTGKTVSTLDVVTAVRWTGTALQYQKAQLQFTGGVLVDYTAPGNSWTTINTPTVISWS